MPLRAGPRTGPLSLMGLSPLLIFPILALPLFC
jgi:hypothetical protein